MTKPSPLDSPRGPIAWMAGHSVAANLIMLACLVGGFLSLRTIKQEVFPEIQLDMVEISVDYPGASPEEVESGIILAVEEAVRDLDGVDEVSATALEGRGTVTVELLRGADLQKLAQDITSEVDRIRTFPEEAEEPEVRIVSRRRAVLSIILYGDTGLGNLHQVAERVRDQLLQDSEITQVDVEGVPPLEIDVSVPQENLRRYGLKLTEVAARLRNASVDLPGGGLKTKSGEVLVRVKERRDYGRQFARLPIVTTEEGTVVRLEEIAEIDDGFEDTDRYSRYDGHPAVVVEVYRVGDQTPIQVADAVRRNMETIAPNLPPGLHASIHNDRSEHYRERVYLLLRNGALGLGLVIILLAVFLEARLAFWVMMGIPISFMGSFLFLPLTGVTINMISLFAYIIALGIVVDDAIVVGENICHYREQGMGFLAASIRGTREVAMPVSFSILTNITAFMPLYFIPGILGKIEGMIPIVVMVVFLVSLVESVFVLPAHLAHQRGGRARGPLGWLAARQQAFSDGFRKLVRIAYGPVLGLALRNRYVTVIAAMGILAITLSYAASGRMGFGLFPTIESDRSEARVVLPYGSPVEKTEAVMQRLFLGARRVLEESGHPELVEGILAEVGRQGSHTGQMKVMLADAEIRDSIMSTEVFTNRWRKTVGEVVGVESLRFLSDAGGPGSHSRALSVELSHRHIEVLELASAELADVIRTYPRVKDVDDGFQPGKPQLDFVLKPEGKSMGLTAREVAAQVRGSVYGAEVLRQQRGRNEIKVMVRLPESERASEQTVDELMVRTPAGTYVPFKEIASVKRGRAYTTISRRDGRRVVQVTADVTPRSKAGEVLADLRAEVLPGILARHRGLHYGFEGHRAEMRESFESLKVTFSLALLAIYALLAIPFRSYIQPLIVMSAIPFGLVGAIFGHLIMDYDLCMFSVWGVVALAGVVVNDALVMIDFANRRAREGGHSPFEAIHSAGLQRFRPIFLTTLTTFGGLSPMIFETSRQARFIIPMAVSLGYGIVFATLITLLIVPSLYLIADDLKRAAAWVAGLIAGPVRVTDAASGHVQS